jgi:Tol biopolymer transport system component
MTFGLRPIAVAALCLLGSSIAAWLAYRTLWPYPPTTAAGILAALVVVAVTIAFVSARLAEDRRRRMAVVATVAAGIVVPFLAVTFLPSAAQPPDHVIPGSPTRVLWAAPDGTWDIYLLPNGDADQLIALTDTLDEQEEFPHLSPDGSRIAYTLVRPGGSSELDLMTLNPDGSIASNETLTSSGDLRLAPTTWAPDGTLLVQVKAPGEPARVDRLDMTLHELSPFLANAGNVAYSPDGTQIAYSRPSEADPGDLDIWIADADGSHARDLIHTPGADDDFPSWSPDGGSVLFTSWLHGDGDVYVAEADGSGPANLTPDSRDEESSEGWTPDGHVLFLSNRSHTGGTFLYFMNADGSDVQLALRI